MTLLFLVSCRPVDLQSRLLARAVYSGCHMWSLRYPRYIPHQNEDWLYFTVKENHSSHCCNLSYW